MEITGSLVQVFTWHQVRNVVGWRSSFDVLTRQGLFTIDVYILYVAYPGNGQTGVTSRPFQTNGRVGKTGLRQVPACAPASLEFNFDTLARRLQPMPSTHTLVLFRHVIGADGTAVAQEGGKGPALLGTILGGYAHAILLYYPFLTSFRPL